MTALSDLVGSHVLKTVPRLDVRHPFDADAGGAAFMLGDTTYLAFEDPNDNYRSSLGVLLQFSGDGYQIGGFYPEYLHLPVFASMDANPSNHVLELRDAVTGPVVFRLGTEATDDYYPRYVAQWTPVGAGAV